MAAFGTLLVACLAVGLIQAPKPFYGDAAYYWALGSTFESHGSFSFLHYEYLGLRGYTIPLVYYLLAKVGNWFGSGATTDVVVFNAILFALLGGVLGPALARAAWPRRAWGLVPRLALGALLLIFWGGYLNFPLSDFPALVAAVLAVVAASRSTSPGWLLVSGLAAAFALNARPAYLPLIPLLVLVVAWSWWRERADLSPSPRRAAACVVAFVVGLAIVTVPQSIVSNHNGFGFELYPSGAGLENLQLAEGLRLQRYSTYVGENQETKRMEYIEPSTASIREGLPLGLVANNSVYLEIIAAHPLTMAGVFLHHIVNGLDDRYSTPYVEHLETTPRKLFRLAGFLLVFLAVFRLLWPRGRRSLGEARWRFAAILPLCCVVSIPSAMETRFMLPVFLVSGLIVLSPGWPSPLESGAAGLRRFRTVAVGCLALALYLAVVISIASGATHNLQLS